MSKRNHSKSRSPVQRDVCRMSQASTIAASSQSDSLMLAHTPARADFPGERCPALQQSPGAPFAEHHYTGAGVFACSIERFLVSWGPASAGSCAGLQGLLRLFTLRMLILSRVHASPPFSHVWPPLFCLTRGRHPLRPFSLPSVMATTGAASVPAEASPPSLTSCAMSRTSTRAPLWTSPLAPCSRRSNESLARLPPAVASEEWAPGSAIGAGRPVRPGPPRVG